MFVIKESTYGAHVNLLQKGLFYKEVMVIPSNAIFLGSLRDVSDSRKSYNEKIEKYPVKDAPRSRFLRESIHKKSVGKARNSKKSNFPH